MPPLRGDDLLRRRVARLVESRLRRVLRLWKRRSRARGFPKLGRGGEQLAEALRITGGDPRVRFLAGGRLRSWMHAAEGALDLLQAAWRQGARSDLVERVSDMGLLARLAPSGRLPRDFAARAARAARSQLADLAAQLPVLALWILPFERWPRSMPMTTREDQDLGRSAGTADLPSLVSLTRSPRFGLGVGHVVRTRGTQMSVLQEDRRFQENVTNALAFLGAVWPEAAQMVTARTWWVVPVEEAGVVSYSSAVRPGVSWIHVTLGRGSGADGAMRLAEHLLHEGTHQRVHDLELLAPIASGGDEGPRFYSPWRRQWRPLRGLLHGACTFSVGAAYFERTLHAYEEGRVPVWPQRGLWLARRFLEEMESVRVALRHLRGAEGEGLLPVGGRRLLAAVAREHAALRRATRRRRAQLAATEEGRKQLEGVEAHARQLRSEPVRWDLD